MSKEAAGLLGTMLLGGLAVAILAGTWLTFAKGAFVVALVCVIAHDYEPKRKCRCLDCGEGYNTRHRATPRAS